MHNYDTLSEEFLQYKKSLGYKYNETTRMNEIKRFLKKNKVKTITKDVIEKYAKLNPNRKQNTVARNLGLFREFCIYLKMQGIDCYQIPKTSYRQNPHSYKAYIFSHDEIDRIIKYSQIIVQYGNYSLKKQFVVPLIIRILYQTGMRIGEVLNLKVKDYNQDESSFLIRDSKNSQERLIFLPSSLNQLIIEYNNEFKYDIDEYLFQLTNGKISKSVINKNFDKILKLSNIIKTELAPRIHDLRHTFIVHTLEKWISEGKDINAMLPILQTHLGHQSIHALEYYYQNTIDILILYRDKIENELGHLIPLNKESEFNE